MNFPFVTRLNLLLFAVVLVLSFWARPASPLWEGYADPKDYLYQSRIPLSSRQFWIPEKKEGFYPRPFTVPLFYKLAGSEPETIILMQKCVHALSIFLLGATLVPLFSSDRAKITFLAGWYLLMSWWNILGWASTLLSESLSATLMFIWLASFLYVSRHKALWTVAIHILATVLFSFTRDSWPYILVIFYGLYVLVAFVWQKHLWKIWAGMLAFSVCLFFTQQYMGKVGQRYRLPVMNNIVFRVLPYPEYVAWFEQQGMPDAPKLLVKYGHLNAPTEIYPLYDDTEFSEFSAWAASKGNQVYARFLLTHPSVLFFGKGNSYKLDRMFAWNFGYVGDPKGFSRIVHYVFPVPLVLVLVVFGITFYLYKSKANNLYIFSIIILIVTFFNAWLLFVADALEVERHEYITITMVQLIVILSIALITDKIVVKVRE